MEQIHDLEQAKMVIDMRNDEISSLQSSMKMVEMKANKNIAEANYRVTTEKNRADTLKKEADRLKEELLKVKAALAKAEEGVKATEGRHQAELKESAEKLRLQRQQLRTVNVQAREAQVSMQQLEAEVQSLKKQLRPYRRIVNAAKIFELTGKVTLQDIPSYVDLLGLLKDKADQICELRDKLQSVTEQALGIVSEKEKKMSTYEQQLEHLKQEKQKLDSQLQAKSEMIMQKEQQLEMHKQMLDETKHHHQMTYEELVSELSNLRTSVSYYERESIRQSAVRKSSSTEQNLKILHELAAEFEQKEESYQKQIEHLEQELTESLNSKRAIEKELMDENVLLKGEMEELQAMVDTMSSERRQNLMMIETLQRQTLDFQRQYEQVKLERERLRKDAEDSVRVKNELRERLTLLTEQSRARQQQLMSQIERLRQQSKEISEDMQMTRRYSRLSMDVAAKQQADYEQLYKVGLKSHNRFLQQVFNMLSS